MDYDTFLQSKRFRIQDAGIDIPLGALNGMLFDFQALIVQWALRKGKAALFVDTGLGKTGMQLEWAHQVCLATGGSVLILAPLAVAQQTKREGEKFGIPVTLCRTAEDIQPGICVTNYDRLHLFDPSSFVGVVLDESSILKSYSGATCRLIIESFARTPYRIACSATPAPNDHVELGNHAEFLGVMSRTEMLAIFFVHDGGDTSKWRLMGHAEEIFWQFVGGWAVAIRKPSDLGFEDGAYNLPALNFREHCLELEETDFSGKLFGAEAETLTDQRRVRRSSLGVRCAHASALVRSEHAEPFLVWCELNDESAELVSLIPGAVEVKGADSAEHKEQSIMDFIDGKIRVLVSKPSIFGYGLNLQCCARQVFVGVSHSYEMLYQTIRRSWRFGQTRPVDVHLIYSRAEQPVIRNLKRKQEAHETMSEAMVTLMCSASGIAPTARQSTPYVPTKEITLPCWLRQAA